MVAEDINGNFSKKKPIHFTIFQRMRFRIRHLIFPILHKQKMRTLKAKIKKEATVATEQQ